MRRIDGCRHRTSRLARHSHFCGGSIPSIEFDANFLPPGLIRSFMFADVNRNAIRCLRAREIHPHAFAPLVGKRLAVIEIERTAALATGIDAESKITDRALL